MKMACTICAFVSLALSTVVAFPLTPVEPGMLDGIAAGIDHLQASKKHNQLLDAQLELVKMETAQFKYQEQYKHEKMVPESEYLAKVAEMDKQMKTLEATVADLQPKDEKSKKLEQQVVAAAAKRVPDEKAIAPAAPASAGAAAATAQAPPAPTLVSAPPALAGATAAIAGPSALPPTDAAPKSLSDTVVAAALDAASQSKSQHQNSVLTASSPSTSSSVMQTPTIPAFASFSVPAFAAPAAFLTPATSNSNSWANKATTNKIMLLQQAGLSQA